MKLAKLLKGDPVAVGIVPTDEASRAMVEASLPVISAAVKDSFPEFAWRWELGQGVEAGEEPLRTLLLFDQAYRAVLERRWDFCVVVTEKRLGAGESASGLMKVSLSHSSAVVSLSRLRPFGGEPELARTDFCNLFLEALARLNGVKRAVLSDLIGREEVLRYAPGERREMARHLRELARVLPQERLREISRLAYYLWISLKHPIWIIRATLSLRPWSMVYRSTRLLFASLATMALSLVTMEFWDLGVGQSIWRTVLLGVGLILAAGVFVIWKHHLLEREDGGELSSHGAVFKISTVLSVLLGFTFLFLALFVANVLLTLAVFPRSLISRWLAFGMEKVPLSVYFRVSLFSSCLALAVGALGAGLEDSENFRYLLYGGRRE